MKKLILALTLIPTSLQAQTYTQMQWGYNAASATPVNYKIGVSWVPLSLTVLNYTSPGAGAATNKTANQFLDDLAFDVNFFSNVNPNTATNSATGINAAILAANNIGGGIVRFPAGNNYNITSSITMQKGSNLLGSFPTTEADTSLPYLLGSRLKAGANISALVTQPSISSSVHSMSIKGMTIDGNKASYSVTNLVDWAPINSYMSDSYIVGGTGNCIRHKANSGASWIDWYVNNTIGSCTGSGLLFEGSDTFILGNYFSGNGANITMNSSGSIIANNQIEVSNGDGIVTGNNPITPLYFQVSPWVGNYFVQNVGYDIHYLDPGSTFRAMSPVVGNSFHASKGVKFENNVNNALFVGDYFSDGSGANDIAFTNSTNTGVQIIGTSHTKSVATRFANLPSDTQVISGGPGGAYNRLQSLVIANPASNVGVETTAPRVNVYGSDTVLGQANTAARFGISKNASGFDSALLLGVQGGNAPFMSCVNGELTAAVACSLYFNSTLVWNANASNFTSYIPMLVGSNGFTQGSIGFNGLTSGTATITSQAAAGTPTLTLPTTSGTLVSSATAPLSINATTGVASITGAAGTVLAGVSPAFTATPTLGVNATTTGQLGFANGGALGATVTVQNNAATAAYNFNLPATSGTSSHVLTSAGGGASAMTWTSPTTTVNGQSCTLGSTCTVTAAASSIPFPQTVSGTVTSGGIPYFDSTTQMSSSALLAANAIMIGGGAGVAPSTTTTGTGVVTAIGNNTNSTGGLVTYSGNIGAASGTSLAVGNGSAANPSITNTGNLNAGMFFPAANTVAIGTTSTGRMRFDSSGRIFQGSDTYIQVNPYSIAEIYSVYGTAGNGFQLGNFSADAFATAINMGKSRSSTIGTNTIVQNGDALGNMYFNGANGTGYSFGAGISAAVDGATISTSSMPGRLEFKTTPSGSTSLVTRMTINNAGNATFSYAMVAGGTAPTATGAGGTCAAGAVAGGATAGTVTLTAACASTNTLALTSMPAAPTGYVCDAADRTNKTLNLVQSATTTTSVTFTFNATTGATDVIQYKCVGY